MRVWKANTTIELVYQACGADRCHSISAQASLSFLLQFFYSIMAALLQCHEVACISANEGGSRVFL